MVVTSTAPGIVRVVRTVTVLAVPGTVTVVTSPAPGMVTVVGTVKVFNWPIMVMVLVTLSLCR